jgi:hypothetical protein
MSVMEHLQLRQGIANDLRWLVMCCLAAALAWSYPAANLSLHHRLWLFAAVLLYLWLLGTLYGTLMGAPMARVRCPRCAGKFALRPDMRACPFCRVTFTAEINPSWRIPRSSDARWSAKPTLR